MSLRRHTVILADDHRLVRAGIRSILASFEVCQVLAECADGLDVLHQLRRCQPDVLLLDVGLPGLNGFEVLERIDWKETDTRVLMLSMHSGPEYVARALVSGAHGYLLKDSAVEELRKALSTVLAGRRYIGQGINARTVERMMANWEGEQPELAALTPRQRQILQLVAEGNSTRMIAESLHISVKTVETHRATLMRRLGIQDVPGLVRFALRTGLVTPER